MPEAISSVLYAVVLAAAFVAAPRPDPRRRLRERLPVATMVALLIVAVPTLAQLTVAPGLLGSLRRDWVAIGSGEMWRLVTALVVQDGGFAGATFNLISLAVIGSAAEAVWGWRRWLVLALAAGVGAQLWGWVVQPVGAGNSVAVFGLAAALAVVGLRREAGVHRLVGAISLLASAVLLLTGDLHGGAAAIGAAIATWWSRGAEIADG